MLEINNLTTNPVDENFLNKVAETVLKREQKKDSDLSIVFVGQGRIRELNKKYRGKNRVTDVLSFLWDSKKETKLQKKLNIPEDTSKSLGEIVICLREVKKNAKRYNSTFEKELAKVLIHGILHLLGYEHEKSEKEKDKMMEKEERYLSQFFK
jgi:probable rRNA maturation factor